LRLVHYSLSFLRASALCLLANYQVSTPDRLPPTDLQGDVVPNVTVTVKNNVTGKDKTLQTNDSGSYQIPTVWRMYSNRSSTSSCKTAYETEVKVNVGTPTTIKVVLEFGTAQETVMIIGGGELLQTQTVTLASSNGANVNDLPVCNPTPVPSPVLLRIQVAPFQIPPVAVGTYCPNSDASRV
jgi:hypothetical protein